MSSPAGERVGRLRKLDREGAAGPLPVAVLVGVAAAVGGALRLWLLLHRPLTSDEAITGLMAARIRHGQVFTFFWGNAYGGVDQYVAAVTTAAASHSPLALNSTATILWAATAAVVWRAGRRLVPPDAARVALVAAGAMWVWPGAILVNSTTELGIRSCTVLAGVALVLVALRVDERPTALRLGVLGVVAGVGWWSSPEIVYFVVPAAGCLCGGARRTGPRRAGERRRGRAGTRLGLVVAGALLGAAPWLATNVRTGFASLHTSASPDYLPATYAGRLVTFVERALPVELGLRLPLRGTWVGGSVGQTAYGVALAGIVGVCLVAVLRPSGQRRWALRGLGVGVLVLPLLQALFPATSYWVAGYYGVYAVPLLVLLLVAIAGGRVCRAPVGAHVGGRARVARAIGVRRLVAVAGVALLGVTGLSLVSFDDTWLGGHPARFADRWRDPDAPIRTAVGILESRGLTVAYAEYWEAYDLDYLSGGRLEVTDPYTDRWVAEERRVETSVTVQAWLFPAPGRAGEAEAAFSSAAPGPFGYPESLFTAKLGALGVAYRVVSAGVLDAIVPVRAVTPAEVGIPPPYWR